MLKVFHCDLFAAVLPVSYRSIFRCGGKLFCFCFIHFNINLHAIFNIVQLVKVIISLSYLNLFFLFLSIVIYNNNNQLMILYFVVQVLREIEMLEQNPDKKHIKHVEKRHKGNMISTSSYVNDNIESLNECKFFYVRFFE